MGEQIKSLAELLMLGLLVMGAGQDVRTHRVSDLITVPFAALGVVIGLLEGRWFSCGAAALVTVLILFGSDTLGVGGADGIVFAGLTAAQGICDLPVYLIVSMASGLVIAGVERFLLRRPILTAEGNRIAFLPVILLSLPAAQLYLDRVWHALVGSMNF